MVHLLVAALTLTALPVVLSAQLGSIKKVGIVGSGPAGLSLAAALQQLDSGCQEICIFEGRESFLQPRMGGGVQLSGGAAVIAKLGFLPELDRLAQPLQSIRARNAQSKELLEVDVSALIQARAPGLVSPAGQPMFYSVMRDGLQKLLFDMSQAQPRSAAGSTSQAANKAAVNVQVRKDVVGLEEDAATKKVTLIFGDGQREGGFDMVFGADGIKSAARDYVRGGGGAKDADVRYTGIKIVYGVTGRDDDFSLRPGGRGAFWQWFGDSAYVLSASYGGLTGVQHMMAVVYRDKNRGGDTSVTTAADENAEWRSSAERSKKEKLRAFLARSGFTASSGLFSLLDACDEGRFVELAVNDRSAPLLGWASASGRVVLLGDACHAMAPFLGQGANQAIQDAFVLASKVKRLNARASSEISDLERLAWGISPLSPLQLAMLDYQRIRLLPTSIVSVKSNFLGAVETLGGSLGCFVRDNFFRFNNIAGIAKLVILSGALPSIGEERPVGAPGSK